MTLFVKLDFRPDGKLGAWWTREEGAWHKTNTTIAETRIRKVLVALADEIDPEDIAEPQKPDEA